MRKRWSQSSIRIKLKKSSIHSLWAMPSSTRWVVCQVNSTFSLWLTVSPCRYLGPSSADYSVFNDSKWTLFEADTASASGRTNTPETSSRGTHHGVVSDVKVTPCTVASLATGAGKILPMLRVRKRDLLFSVRPSTSGNIPTELKSPEQIVADLVNPGKSLSPEQCSWVRCASR